MRHRPDQRFTEALGFGTRPRLGDRARKAQPLERQTRVADHRDDAGAQIIEEFRTPPQFDGDDAEISRIGGDRPDQPGASQRIVDDDAPCTIGIGCFVLGDGFGDSFGNFRVTEPLRFPFQSPSESNSKARRPTNMLKCCCIASKMSAVEWAAEMRCENV